MGASSLEPAVEQTGDSRGGTASLRACREQAVLPGRGIIFQYFPQRYGFPPPRAHRHPVAGLWMAIDRLVDDTLGPVRRSPHERPVAALQWSSAAMVGELSRKRTVSTVILGHHHQAGRILVKPMDDSGSAHSADTGKGSAAMGHEGID